MSRIDRLLNRGIKFARSGREEDARSLLRAVIADEPKNRLAWGWYVQSFSDEDERIQTFDGYLQVFPEDRNAVKLQATLLKKQNSRWKQLVDDNIAEIDCLRQENAKEIRRKDHTINKTRLATVVISLLLIGIFCVGSSGTFTETASLTSENRSLKKEFEALETIYQTLDIKYTTLYSDHSSLIFEHNNLEDQHNLMVGEYNGLVDTHKSLVENYHSLDEEYNSLNSQYTVLSNDYNDLVTTHSTLRTNYDNLTVEHQNLASDYDDLDERYIWLQENSIPPPYIHVDNRMIKMAFYDSNGSIIHWETPFSHLENFIVKGNDTRSSILVWGLNTHKIYLDNGEWFLETDFSTFLDPDSFENVIGQVYRNSNSSDDFIRQVWEIIGQLSDYASDNEREIPRFPSETMLAGGGDCEDLSILFASMIKAAPTNWFVDLVYVDSYNILAPKGTNHVIVYIDTGERTYLIETTSDTEMMPYENGVRGWLASKMNSSETSDRFPVTLH